MPIAPDHSTEPEPEPEPQSQPAGMLDAAEAGPEDRVLVVGGDGAALLCAALRRGCLAATGVVAPPRHPEPADLVLAPDIASAEDAASIAACARRALGTGLRGRLALGLRGGAGLARAAMRRLRRQGFRHARLRASEGGVLLLCDLAQPMAGAR